MKNAHQDLATGISFKWWLYDHGTKWAASYLGSDGDKYFLTDLAGRNQIGQKEFLENAIKAFSKIEKNLQPVTA
jgi:hypothetical protein